MLTVALALPPTNPQTLSSKQPAVDPYSVHTERGHLFSTGPTFYRPESSIGRDLAILSAVLHKRSTLRPLRVLDALCGCGIRSLRYLLEADADYVVANDANDGGFDVIKRNLARVGEGRWEARNEDANKVMMEMGCWGRKEFFEIVDVDSFGSDIGGLLRGVFGCVRFGGLVYLTSTDGYSSGGHRPHHSLAAFGAYVRPMPYSNEVGLRMLIGGAIREASLLGYRVTPLFSYYSYHGPVFRVMLRVEKGRDLDNRHYEFISYCHSCGHSQSHPWEELGRMCCICDKAKDRGTLVVSGPLYTGSLHSGSYVMEMIELAEELGWIGNGKGADLEKLLRLMIDESNVRLPFGFIKVDEVAKRAKINSPPLRTMMNAIQQLELGFIKVSFVNLLLQEGYAVSRSHIIANAIKTDCPMDSCIRIAKELQQ
ncbi:hypothetical protein MLD38_024111 [Melastoma candidum]|uniref:Uncharacterized protein n=1 Tax=Melastoma candidum TaxID=119954 RepID=A0ACB9NY18_9MYRT|nr:hypothetical protein MLD38_024111 [Melastoma candidum]